MPRLLLLSLLVALSCGFAALPIENAANSSRVDARAADGRGGWLDLGSHDLGVLPAGEARYAGVTFVVPPAGDENARNCIVIGRSGPETAVLSFNPPNPQTLKPSNSQTLKPSNPQTLYLLHARGEGPAPETHKTIGKVVLRYADGSTSAQDVQVGRDVSHWTSGRSFANAARAWTEYNFNTQVSLFVSKFKLDAEKTLVGVSFSANGVCPWMVLAATVGKDTRLSPVRGSAEPTGTYKSPKPPEGLVRTPGKRPKNVILIIGDGMGPGAVGLASYYKYGRADSAYFQQLPVVGLCSTFSADRPVTDSAAAATAFATGVKTSNGVLGLQVDEQHARTNAVWLTSVAARAHARGCGVALLTSDPLFGATPSAFFAHAPSRGDSALICEQAAECGYEVLVGAAGSDAWFRPKSQGGKRADGRDLVAEMAARGYAFVHTPEAMREAPREAKILGSFTSFGDEEAIGAAVRAALERVGDMPNGFFMMAECADTDHANHRNDTAKAIKAVSMVEFMAEAAVDFARPRGDTLVIVTADHDTGHPSVVRGSGADGRLVVQWMDTSHTRFPVALYAYGPGAELFEGIIDNTDIAKNIARLWGSDK